MRGGWYSKKEIKITTIIYVLVAVKNITVNILLINTKYNKYILNNVQAFILRKD